MYLAVKITGLTAAQIQFADEGEVRDIRDASYVFGLSKRVNRKPIN